MTKQTTAEKDEDKFITDPKLSEHTLSVYVNNKPGVLARIAQTFARRGFNIDSLVVSHGRDQRFSRMTIGLSGNPDKLDQIIKQVHKLIDVINCSEHDAEGSVAKELALVKFHANDENRSHALQILSHFRALTHDLNSDTMIASISGDPEKINAFLRALRVFSIVEVVRTGKIAIAKGSERT